MPSRRSLLIISLLALIFPLLIAAQGYDFSHPSPSLPTNSDPAPQYTPPNPVTSQGRYNVNPSPNGGGHGLNPSPLPSDSGIYVVHPSYVSKPPSQYNPSASAPSNPAYGRPPSNCTAPTYIPPPSTSNPPSYIAPPSYEAGLNSSGPIISFPTSSSSTGPSISNSTIPTRGATTNTTSAGGNFSSLTSLSTTGEGSACLTQATGITTVTQTFSFTVTFVLTEVRTETVTLQPANLVGVPVIPSVFSTPPTFSPAPTTLQISTVGVGLNSSLTNQTNSGALNATTTSSPTNFVVLPVYGSPLSYVSPAPSGYGLPKSYGSSPPASYGSASGYGEGKSGSSSQPSNYSQPSAYNNGGDDDNGYGALPSNGGEEGNSEAGSGSYGNKGEQEGDTVGDGDVETGPWALGSAPDYEDGGSESREQSGGSVFLDWLLEILK